MLDLQPFNCFENLFNLISFGSSLVILDINPWVANPWSLVNAVASACLTGWAKIMVTYPAEIGKASAAGINAHGFKEFLWMAHAKNDTNSDTCLSMGEFIYG